jgi:lysophospholipase L1-like esterase
VTAVLPAGAITVDFNVDAHRALTEDLENFQDEVHLSGKGSRVMEQKLHEVLVEHLNPADFQEPDEEEEE